MADRLYDPDFDLVDIVAHWDPNKGVTTDANGAYQWVDTIGGINASTTGTRAAMITRFGKPWLNFANNVALAFTPPASFPVGDAPGMILVSAYLNTTTGPGRWAFHYGSGNSNTRYVNTADVNPIGRVSAGTGGAGSNVYTSNDWIKNDRLLIACFGTGKSIIANVDGGADQATTLSNNINTNRNRGTIGKWSDYGDYWDGPIGHIIVTKSMPSAAVRTTLAGWESWASGKNGSNLPADHPNKNSAPRVGGIIKPRRRSLILLP